MKPAKQQKRDWRYWRSIALIFALVTNIKSQEKWFE